LLFLKGKFKGLPLFSSKKLAGAKIGQPSATA
jgi:hypothetical protein